MYLKARTAADKKACKISFLYALELCLPIMAEQMNIIHSFYGRKLIHDCPFFLQA